MKISRKSPFASTEALGWPSYMFKHVPTMITEGGPRGGIARWQIKFYTFTQGQGWVLCVGGRGGVSFSRSLKYWVNRLQSIRPKIVLIFPRRSKNRDYFPKSRLINWVLTPDHVARRTCKKGRGGWKKVKVSLIKLEDS